MLASGEELATAASQALGVKMKFENISEYVHIKWMQAIPLFSPLSLSNFSPPR